MELKLKTIQALERYFYTGKTRNDKVDNKSGAPCALKYILLLKIFIIFIDLQWFKTKKEVIFDLEIPCFYLLWKIFKIILNFNNVHQTS